MPIFVITGGASAVTAGTDSVSGLITAAFQRLNLYSAGETLSPEDMALGFSRLNDLLDSLATEHLLSYAVIRTTFPITQTQDYTVGTGATINVVRPASPNEVYLAFEDTAQNPTQEYPLGMPVTEDGWAAIGNKSVTSLWPTIGYYNPTFTGAGYATISLWPIPTSTTLRGVLYSPQRVTQFATTATTVLLPPGYKRCYRDNLAIELAPDYPDVAKVTDELRHSAIESKANCKRVNERLVDLQSDAAALFGCGGGYNIYTDT